MQNSGKTPGWGVHNFYTKFCQKMRPIFIPESQILSKITKNFTLFSKIVKLSSKFQKFWYRPIRLMKLGVFLCQF